MSTEHTYKFNIAMSCSGCSGAVTRVLAKNPSVSSFEVSLEKQEAIVHATSTYDEILAVINKTGKQVISGETVV